MRYVSTRGAAPILGFGEVLLAGLADDGGLYVPESWPSLAAGGSGDYLVTALEVMSPFVGGAIAPGAFADMVREAYATFESDEVTPLVDLGDGLYLLELFHGPTLAFKDVALQLVGRLFDHELSRRGERVTIVGATSGDTGSAAIDACRDRESMDIVILHPADRVSDVQRRQMTTVPAANVHNVAVEGTFDDCQDLVKAMFADAPFRQRMRLSAVNSINWARVMAQVVYYVVAAERLGGRHVPVSFSVPTGNFGNALAGHAARHMGLDIEQLVIGSNSNDILTRFFTAGTMTLDEVVPTLSPSMDIQVSSNLERLLFELLDRDGAAVAALLDDFRGTGTIVLDPALHATLGDAWSAARFHDDEVLRCIAEEADRSGVVLDPHSAVGVSAARHCRRDHSVPMVALATAHPAKFPDAVESATGVRPDLPERLGDLFDRPERFSRLPNDLAAIQAHVDACVAG
ncbi:MAG TPA: threonine synthase [Acidimicrobiales bacterium]|jgi:threonine synthase|nr:threonine synthase [Actinomycetes bacterium]MDP6106085.1 threonine synthase [Acidimicrobiales bacterium]MDP6239897.1 threonine synthase [Acidimicrobiales bacterium]MDP6493631.1 threonine synthase [Acidimicrobiales bacterium]MDP7124358.1 threonine synthase [Acidimicrobiales bacterium]|tara:strand:- start:295 stop:1674 length:1380 start_codon:yes stop_codon:yes gene_type:complete